MTEGGQMLARASREPGKLVPPGPSAQALRDARQVRGYGVVEPVGDKGLLLRVIVSLETPRHADEARLLQLTHWVPQTLAEQGESVQSVYRAYKELSLSRQGLKEIYILTLTLTLLLALLSAIALAFLLSRRLSNPLAVLAEFARMLQAEFEQHRGTAWQQQIEMRERGAVILVRGSPLPETGGGGYVVVFDDVTQLIAAQRATAWGEVARRLAHEIKNPLTPIQLAAERLQAKLGDKLSLEAARALDHATETIVAQVTAMKNMVDNFRDYARTPPPQLGGLDLNRLVTEVLALYEQSGTRIQANLQKNVPLVRGDPDRLRQVIHNLLQNAQDALFGSSDPKIEVSTELSGGQVWLRISDSGCGVPEAIINGAFEPYVTTKPKGTGLGLAIVKRIIDEHHGTVRIENRIGKEGGRGAAVRISLPLAA